MKARRRRGPWRRVLLGLSLLILAFPLAGLGAIWWTLPGRPIGLAAAIAFDADGVPTIRAASERDAAIALGYLHARDRLFQMEMMRRNAEGRLSELVGPCHAAPRPLPPHPGPCRPRRGRLRALPPTPAPSSTPMPRG
jgi:penicillin amidase